MENIYIGNSIKEKDNYLIGSEIDTLKSQLEQANRTINSHEANIQRLTELIETQRKYIAVLKDKGL